MIVSKLAIKYDRGTSLNRANDIAESADGVQVGVLGRGALTKDGKVIRGLGSHFRSEAEAQLVQQRDKEAKRIYTAFRERFLATPIDGLYAVQQKGDAKKFVEGLNPVGIEVRVSEFVLTTEGDLEAAEVREWCVKIKRQLQGLQFGRKKEINDQAINSLLYLAKCPLIAKDTKTAIQNLVEAVKLQKIERFDLRRSLEKIEVNVDMTQVNPTRSMPKLAGAR